MLSSASRVSVLFGLRYCWRKLRAVEEWRTFNELSAVDLAGGDFDCDNVALWNRVSAFTWTHNARLRNYIQSTH